MATKHGKLVTYREGLLGISSSNPVNTSLREISTTTMSMVAKPGMVVTYCEGLPLKITWLFNYVILRDYVKN